MADFSALVAKSETIELAGVEVAVYALSVSSLTRLASRYVELWAALKGGDFVGAIGSASPTAIADIVIEATKGEIPRNIAMDMHPAYAGLIIATVVELTMVELEKDPKLGNLLARPLAGLMGKLNQAMASSTSSPS